MTRLLGALLLVLMAGCSPTITESGDDRVSIRFNNYFNSGTTLRPLADAECAKSNKKAVFDVTTTGTGFIGYATNLPTTARYKCVAGS